MTAKVLCNNDGSVFCNWSDKHKVFAIYFSEEDNLPNPEDLNIRLRPGCVADTSTMFWKSVRVQTAPLHNWEIELDA